MKTMVYALIGLVTWTTLVSTQGVELNPNFEFWNKSKETVYVTLVDPSARPSIADLRPVGPNGRVQAHINIVSPYILFVRNNKMPLGVVNASIFPGNSKKATYKSIYVRLTEDGKTVGPQTGPYKGWLGKTESGLSLKDNIKENTITSLKVNLPMEQRRPEQPKTPAQKEHRPILES